MVTLKYFLIFYRSIFGFWYEFLLLYELSQDEGILQIAGALKNFIFNQSNNGIL